MTLSLPPIDLWTQYASRIWWPGYDNLKREPALRQRLEEAVRSVGYRILEPGEPIRKISSQCMCAWEGTDGLNWRVGISEVIGGDFLVIIGPASYQP